ncbi:hypothetical protein ABPG77_007690 [Micractinium sp. CCAP 211/92]
MSAAPQSSAIRISKAMSMCLRHKPPPEMDGSGWVPLPALIQHLRQPAATEAVIRRIVAADAKGRFELDDSCSPPRIRAVQGHSIRLEQPLLGRVQGAGATPLAVHITSEEGWAAIQASGELRAMSRTHVHFATEPRHLRRNAWASVLLRLDLPAAMAAGYEFYCAANGVLLCPGPLPVQFVQRVERGTLPDGWQV